MSIEDIAIADASPPRTTAPAASAYPLSLARQSDRALVRGWLWLGLLALVVSGFYSILLVASRTPGVNALLPVADFFRVALVVHVDLSVLVWFLALSGMRWSLSSRPRATTLAWLALGHPAADALGCAGDDDDLAVIRSWPTTFQYSMAACS